MGRFAAGMRSRRHFSSIGLEKLLDGSACMSVKWMERLSAQPGGCRCNMDGFPFCRETNTHICQGVALTARVGRSIVGLVEA